MRTINLLKKFCECGCSEFPIWNKYNQRFNTFINGHQNRGSNNPFLGKKHSKESLIKMSLNSPDYLGKNNPFYGRNHTKETKELNRKAHIGRKHSKATIEKIRNATVSYNI